VGVGVTVAALAALLLLRLPLARVHLFRVRGRVRVRVKVKAGVRDSRGSRQLKDCGSGLGLGVDSGVASTSSGGDRWEGRVG